MIKILISIFIIFTSSYATSYEYHELKSGRYYAYEKILSKTHIRDSKDIIKYTIVCTSSINFANYEDTNKSYSFYFNYSCSDANGFPTKKGIYNAENTIDEIVNTFADLMDHYNLQKKLKFIKLIRVTYLTNYVHSPFLIKFLNTEKGWSKKNYENRTSKFYRNSIYKLIESSNIHKPIKKLFKSYGCTIQLKKYFCEKLWLHGKPVLISKESIIKRGLIKIENIEKEMYPRVDGVEFDVKCK